MRGKRIPLNLQYFAETAGSAAGAEKVGTEAAGGAGKGSADDNAAAGAGQGDAGDAGTEKKTEDASGKWESGREDIEALVREEIRKASMDPQEKEAYEKEQWEKSLADREDAISLRERQADAKELLADNGLPAEFRDMVMGRDRETTEKNVKSLKTRFDEAVQDRVEARLSGRTPSGTAGATGTGGKDALLAEVEGYL